MFPSRWTWKTKKIIILSPVPYYELLVSAKKNTDRKRKKKKEENMDRTQTKLNAP